MRILVAEDDPTSLTILSLMLEAVRGYEVVKARDGDEAWAELERSGGFDLCILDIMMPGIDGLKLTARIRQDPRFCNQRVMLCTALNERSIITQAAALGVSHYVVKPFFKEHVLKQVRRICEEGATEVHFEAVAQVAARLGVEEMQVAEFLMDLHRDVVSLVSIFRSDARAAAAASQLRINSLKGAAINLGARSLASQLASLEDRCSGGHSGNGFEPIVAAVETENQRLHRCLESRSPNPAAARA